MLFQTTTFLVSHFVPCKSRGLFEGALNLKVTRQEGVQKLRRVLSILGGRLDIQEIFQSTLNQNSQPHETVT